MELSYGWENFEFLWSRNHKSFPVKPVLKMLHLSKMQKVSLYLILWLHSINNHWEPAGVSDWRVVHGYSTRWANQSSFFVRRRIFIRLSRRATAADHVYTSLGSKPMTPSEIGLCRGIKPANIVLFWSELAECARGVLCDFVSLRYWNRMQIT